MEGAYLLLKFPTHLCQVVNDGISIHVVAGRTGDEE